MSLEEKIEFAKGLYASQGLNDVELAISRDEEISADYVGLKEPGRGAGAFIIADDGTFLFCQSAHGYSYWKEQFKTGKRNDLSEKKS